MMAIDRAFALREIREQIGIHLQLPQLAAFAKVAREFRTTCRAWLPAPCRQELLWVSDDPFAYTFNGLPTVMRSVLSNFYLDRTGVHRARARRLKWTPSNRDWRRVPNKSYTPDVARFVQRLRPRLIRGFEGDGDYLDGDARALDDEDMHDALGRRLTVLHEIVSASVEGAPGCVLLFEIAYFCTADEWENGEEIFARLSFSADGGEPRELCHQKQGIHSDLGIMFPEGLDESAAIDGREDFCVSDPEFWRDRKEPTLIPNRQAFANRFAVNDPLRTCDMHQTLIGLLHYSFEVFTSGGPVLDGRDYGSWVPVTVPW